MSTANAAINVDLPGFDPEDMNAGISWSGVCFRSLKVSQPAEGKAVDVGGGASSDGPGPDSESRHLPGSGSHVADACTRVPANATNSDPADPPTSCEGYAEDPSRYFR